MESTLQLFKVSLVLLIFISSHFGNLKLNVGSAEAAAVQQRTNGWKDLMISETEKETLDKFKERVIDQLPDSWMKTDFYLIKWLRAKELQIDQAEKMLLENVRWRQDKRINGILNEDFSDISNDYQMTADTHDKKGRPIGTINFGAWDLRKGVQEGKRDRIDRYMDFIMESLMQQVLKAQSSGQEVTRAMILLDLTGFNMFQGFCRTCVSIYFKILGGLEAHYPGFWEEILAINSPPMFQMVLNTVTSKMSEDSKHVIKMLGTNKGQWMAYLDERIDRDQRYTNFGGNKKPQ